MANDSNKSYPRMPASAWWKLREKFNQTIPPQITADYIVSVLGGTSRSARANVMPALVPLGLVDEERKPTERATRWRDDASYPDVCREIRDAVYPGELLAAAPGPKVDRAEAVRWFMSTTRCGNAAAGKMAALYSILVEADPTGGKRGRGGSASTRTKGAEPEPPVSLATPAEARKPKDEAPAVDGARVATGHGPELPEVRLNLEIRIDASVTPEQIEMIFSSMAKHLYDRGN